MSFMDKFKQGVVEAGSKAKTLVEINRIKLQNNSKKNEMEQQYQEIGKLVFDAAEEGRWPLPKEQFEQPINHILQLKWEIEQNLQLIQNLTDEKTCKSCGSRVSVNDRFCSKCGYTFEITQEPVQIMEEGSQLSENHNRDVNLPQDSDYKRKE
ncbi:zinc-ribbon domain-containing protein [Paenibacillus dakarensis]|uniref:zinc-ribbon domain-containing protein n=1 Tax=Paenibacillus dakarensis TaxID=1527293 RepID=UPI0006D562E2|nr:zinc ribbon domain-containing protein [Paenibacillus dakarensis]